MARIEKFETEQQAYYILYSLDVYLKDKAQLQHLYTITELLEV